MTNKQLKDWRIKMDLTRKAAADLLDLTYRHYSNMENGTIEIKKHTIQAACGFYLMWDTIKHLETLIE